MMDGQTTAGPDHRSALEGPDLPAGRNFGTEGDEVPNTRGEVDLAGPHAHARAQNKAPPAIVLSIPADSGITEEIHPGRELVQGAVVEPDLR